MNQMQGSGGHTILLVEKLYFVCQFVPVQPSLHAANPAVGALPIVCALLGECQVQRGQLIGTGACNAPKLLLKIQCAMPCCIMFSKGTAANKIVVVAQASAGRDKCAGVCRK